MENSLLQYDFDGHQIRTVIQDGEPCFIAKDVCDVLDIIKYRDAVSRLDDDERGSAVVDTPGGKQEMTTINESGLYSLIFMSRKPNARKFRKWVTSEVLPDIRKYGMYVGDKVREVYENDPVTFNQLMARYVETKQANDALRDELNKNAPYATLGKMVLALPGSVPVADAAQFLAQHGFPMGRNRLYDYGRNEGLLSKQKKRWNKPTQKGIEQGLVNLELDNTTGQFKLTTRTMITPQGLKNIFDKFLREYYPLEVLFKQADNDDTE